MKKIICFITLLLLSASGLQAEAERVNPVSLPYQGNLAAAFYRADFTEVPNDFSVQGNQEFFEAVVKPSFERFLNGENTGQWQPATANNRSLVLANPISWHAVEFYNPTNSEINMMLESRGNGLMNWYRVNDRGEVKSHFDDVWAAGFNRETRDNSNLTSLDLQPGESIQLYLAIQALPNSGWLVKLWEEQDLRVDRQDGMLIDGLYFGLVSTLLLFCLVVFFNIREPVYLFFSLFLMSSGAIVFVASGLYQNYLPAPYGGYGGYYLFVSSGAMDFAASVFSILLLRLHQTNAPLYRGWLFLIAANLANNAIVIYIFDPTGLQISNVEFAFFTSATVAVLELFVYVWTVIACWRTSKVAIYWFLVIFSHSIGLLIWTGFSADPGALPYEPKHLVQFITLFDAIMICIVLAYTYRVERSERVAAQDQSIENLRLARDIEQAKANFISTVSHDLHGPVRAIGFFTELAREKTNSLAASELQRIEENIDTVTALINSLVRFSEAESSRQLSIEKTDLRKVFYTLKNEFEPVARSKDLVLSIPDSDLSVESDPVALSQILRNLIDNAIKYTDEGTVGVLLDEEEGVVCITVADTGRGIAAEHLKQVFDEFYQVSRLDSDGVGLGLSIVARLTQLLGIKVNLSSDVGFGTQIELRIPCQTLDTKAITESVLDLTDQGHGLKGAVFDQDRPGLSWVVEELEKLEVSFLSGRYSPAEADFLVAPGTPEGLNWLYANRANQWVLLVGEMPGFSLPDDRYVVLPAGIDSIRLRAFLQRIIMSSSESS